MRTHVLNHALLAAAAASVIVAGAQRVDSNSSVLVGGRVYSDAASIPVDDAVVVVAEGRIAAVGTRESVEIPSAARVIDCKGLVIVAGFYNAHVHFTDPARWSDAATAPAAALTANLQEMLTKYGYTTVVDAASDLQNTLALRKRIEANEVLGPRIITAGNALYPPDGVPFYLREADASLAKRLPQPSSSSQAASIVQKQMDEGADLAKLFVGSWVARGRVMTMPRDVAGAAASTAHKRGAVVYAHPSNLAGLEVALDAGVDVLAHAIEDTRGVTPDHYARMIRQRLAVVPTLALFRGRFLWDIIDGVRTFAREGGTILFGTDVGYLPNFDHAVEYELLASAGLGWREILAALTVAPAARLGHQTKGKVAQGYDADLVVLGTDPVLGARAFSDVRLTIRAGRVVFSTDGTSKK